MINAVERVKRGEKIGGAVTGQRGCGSKEVIRKGLPERVITQKNGNYARKDYAYIANISSKSAEAYAKG